VGQKWLSVFDMQCTYLHVLLKSACMREFLSCFFSFFHQNITWLPAFSKLRSHPQTKFTAWNWVAMDCRLSNKNFTWICLISIQSLLKLSFVITDWLKLIWGQLFWINIQNARIVFDWRQSIATFTPWILSVGDCVVLKTPVTSFTVIR